MAIHLRNEAGPGDARIEPALRGSLPQLHLELPLRDDVGAGERAHLRGVVGIRGGCFAEIPA
jgi:hypothetical protein